MERKYVLILCPLDKDGYDFAGNKYKEEHSFIQSNIFEKNHDIDKGLLGIYWGKTNNYPYSNILKSKWSVVKTEINSNLLFVEKKYNLVKFKRGMILHIGDIYSGAHFISMEKDIDSHYFIKEASCLRNSDVIGTKEWIMNHGEIE